MGITTIVRIVVLAWSSTLMTLNYAGYVKEMDATFIASVFTSTLATFGIETRKKEENNLNTRFKKSIDSDSNAT